VINKEYYHMEYTAIIKEMSNGWFFAQCEQVPGAMTQGETIDEALENLKEAIVLVLEAEREHGIIRHVDKTIIRRELVTV
jgi:predicted RNase H-like HicB family nuclease